MQVASSSVIVTREPSRFVASVVLPPPPTAPPRETGACSVPQLDGPTVDDPFSYDGDDDDSHCPPSLSDPSSLGA